MVLLDIHMLIGLREKLSHGRLRVILCQHISRRIRKRRIHMLFCLLCQLCTQIFQKLLHARLGEAMRHHQKFIPAKTADEVLLRYRRPKSGRKTTDVYIPRLMSPAVIDAAKIIQIEAHHTHIQRNRRIQDLFTPVLIRKPRRRIQICLLLQRAVLDQPLQRLEKLKTDQDHQREDHQRDALLQHSQILRLLLRVHFGKRGRLIADSEELLSRSDQVGVRLPRAAKLDDLLLDLQIVAA